MSDIVDQARVAVALDGRDAETVLSELTAKTQQYTDALTKAYQAGDKLGMKNALKDLKDTEKELAQVQKQTFDVTKVMNNLNGASLKDLKRAEQEINAELSKMTRGTKEYIDKTKDLQKVSSELKKVKTEMTGVTTQSGGLIGKLKELLPALGIGAIIGGVVSLGKAIFETRAEFQKYEAILKNTLGSETASRQAMAMLTSTASELPISLKEATESYIKLVNRGMNPTKEEMKKLTDVAMSQGKSLDMFVEAMLDAQTGEFERLKEFGIRAKADGDKVSFTFKGQTETVAKTDEAIKAYLISLGDVQGVSGSSAAVMETLEGKVSNLGDAWDNMLNNMGKSTGGVFTTIISWLSTLVTNFGIAFQSIDQIKQQVTDEQDLSNFQNALTEIEVIQESLIKKGMERKEAEAKAAELYREQLKSSIEFAKADLENASESDKKKFQDRIDSNTKELEAVNIHYKKLEEIKLKALEPSPAEKEKQKKQLEDQKKYLDEILLMGTNLTERENNEFNERLKKAGIYGIAKEKLTSDQQKALEILTQQHEENLNKIAADADSKKKTAQDKWNNELLQLNDEASQQNEILLKEKYAADLQAAGDNADKRKAIEQKYQQDLLTLQLGELESRRQFMQALGMDTLKISEEIANKKLEIVNSGLKGEEKNEKDSRNLRKEFGLQTLVEQEADELAKIQEAYDAKLLTTEEYEQAIFNVKLQYAQQYVQAAQSVLNSISGAVTAQKDAELAELDTKNQKEKADLEARYENEKKAAGNNKDAISKIDEKYSKKRTELEKKQKKEENDIRKKYADKEFAVKVGTIIADTALAIMNAFSTLPTPAAIIMTPFLIATGAAQLDAAKAERDKIKQLAHGQYNVIGADDGQLYSNVPYSGEARTGYYPNRTLISERGGEVVIDNPTLRNIQFNAPDIIPRIMANRVQQYAEGNFPVSNIQSAASNQQQAQSDQMVQLIAANITVMQELNSQLKKGIEAYMVMDRFKQALDEYDKLISDVTRS